MDEYRGTEAERLAVLEQRKAPLGARVDHAPEPDLRVVRIRRCKHDFKQSEDGRRKAKRDAREALAGP